MSAPGDPPIIVQGGGGQPVSITFSEEAFPEGTSGSFNGTSQTITRVEVIANGGADVFSVDVKEGEVIVRVYYD